MPYLHNVGIITLVPVWMRTQFFVIASYLHVVSIMAFIVPSHVHFFRVMYPSCGGKIKIVVSY